MKNLNIVVNYQINIPNDEYWIRLEQEGIDDDIATVEDTASLIDKAFDLSACDTTAINTTSSTTTSTATEETLNEAVSDQFDFLICNTDYDGNLNIKVRVIRSNIAEKYKVHITGGEILSTKIINAVVKEEYTIDAASSVTMNYPVTRDSTFSWMQNSVSTGNNIIKRKGTTLYWNDVSSGTISCSYETTYEVLSVKVYGVNGIPGTATIRVVYHGLVEDLETKTPEWYNTDRESCLYNFDIDFPQKVTCYRTIQKISHCSCSKEEINTEIFDEVVTCPDYAPKKCPGLMPECMHFLGTYTREEYIDCYADSYLPGTSLHTKVSDPDFYENTCCTPVGAVKLPDCEVEVLSYKGGQKLDKGEDFYRAIYGNNAKFVPVGIADGCGKHIIRQSIGFNNCCDGVVQLTWDVATSPSTIGSNSAVTVGVNGGGKYKYTWVVSGEGFLFDNGAKSITTTANKAVLITLPVACGTATIVVSDGCSSTTGQVRSVAGSWQPIPDLNGACAAPGMYQTSSHPFTTEYVFLTVQRVSGRYRQTQMWRSASVDAGMGYGREMSESAYEEFCAMLYAEARRQGVADIECLDVPYPRNRYYPVLRNLRNYYVYYTDNWLRINQAVTFPVITPDGRSTSVEEWVC